MELPEKVIEKFWKNVDKTPTSTGCWNWIGSLDHGTPSIRYGDKVRVRVSARKLSLLIAHIITDSSKKIVVQPIVCKNVLCVNPNHLSIVSSALPLWLKRKDTCEKCGTTLTKSGSNNICQPCHNTYNRERRKDPQHNEQIKQYHRDYSHRNKAKLKVWRAAMHQRRKSDPIYIMRTFTSTSVRGTLRRKGYSKNRKSIWKHLPYTAISLKEHLEKLFEPWMTWSNHGVYRPSNWNDADVTTWTWQIDHIIPQSKLPYTSMQDTNFQKAWALENLRPLSAKQNIIDNNRR